MRPRLLRRLDAAHPGIKIFRIMQSFEVGALIHSPREIHGDNIRQAPPIQFPNSAYAANESLSARHDDAAVPQYYASAMP